MFKQLPAVGVADRLSDVKYRCRGIAQWPDAEATVSNYFWAPDPEMPGCGNYQVHFSYRTGTDTQVGTLGINGTGASRQSAAMMVFTRWKLISLGILWLNSYRFQS